MGRLTPLLADVCALLACPVCARGLAPAGAAPPGAAPPGAALRCPAGHSFDIARQGYVNLMPGGARPGTADTAEMVAARDAFLSAGHYAPLAAAVAGLAAECLPPGCRRSPAGPACVLDAGAGTGYYLAAVLGRVAPAVGLAMDISARALRRAARAHPAAAAVGWDIWQPFPMRSGTMSVIINVFAPRNGPEFRRVLRADGALIVVTPGPGHLAELAGTGLLAVDTRKEERLAATLGGHFRLARRQEQAIPLELGRAAAAALAGMGPSARHTAVTGEALARLPDPVPVTAEFRIHLYRPR